MVLRMAWFNLQMYTRKYKFVPPTGCYTIFLFINYSSVPNPIWGSFGSTMILNFLMMAWFTLSFIQSQNNVQQMISSIHMKSKTLFFISNYFSMFLVALFLSLVAVLFPVLTGAFDKTVGLGMILFALFNHVIVSFLSATIAMLFSKNLIRKPINAWLGIILTLVVLLSISSLEENSSFFLLNYILPPISMLVHIMNEGSSSMFHIPTFGIYLISVFYIMILLVICISLLRKKDIL